MSRFSGSQHRDAMKTLRLQRRAEAEGRQAAERARDAERAARRADDPEFDLTAEQELAVLIAVLRILRAEGVTL